MPQARLEDHFEDLAKQAHAAQLGMWLFLGSELLLFAGLFALYASYRALYPRGLRAAPQRTTACCSARSTPWC